MLQNVSIARQDVKFRAPIWLTCFDRQLSTLHILIIHVGLAMIYLVLTPLALLWHVVGGANNVSLNLLARTRIWTSPLDDNQSPSLHCLMVAKVDHNLWARVLILLEVDGANDVNLLLWTDHSGECWVKLTQRSWYLFVGHRQVVIRTE